MTEHRADDPIFYQFAITDAEFEEASKRLGMTVEAIRAERSARTYSVPRRYLMGVSDD